MLQMSVFSSSYMRIPNAKLDPKMKRVYQRSMPVCSSDMFGCFLLDSDPKELVKLTPNNHITFHLRIPILTITAAQLAYDRSIGLKYKLPDVNWHLNSLNKYYNKHLSLWIEWILKSPDNYEWMREVLLLFIEELRKLKSYSDDNVGVVSSVALMAEKEKTVSTNYHESLSEFPSDIRSSKARLIANRWMYAHYTKANVPEWWPYPKTLFSQELIDHIDKVKMKLLRSKKNKIIVLDQVPDIAFSPPPIYLIEGKRKTWEDYDWKAFVKHYGDWHKVYNYDHNWLQRWLQ